MNRPVQSSSGKDLIHPRFEEDSSTRSSSTKEQHRKPGNSRALQFMVSSEERKFSDLTFSCLLRLWLISGWISLYIDIVFQWHVTVSCNQHIWNQLALHAHFVQSIKYSHSLQLLTLGGTHHSCTVKSIALFFVH